MNEEDILSEAFDTPFEQLPKYQQNRANLNASRNIDPDRFQQQINNLPKPTIQDLSELAIDAKIAGALAKKNTLSAFFACCILNASFFSSA